jgi:hypothetical protein
MTIILYLFPLIYMNKLVFATDFLICQDCSLNDILKLYKVARLSRGMFLNQTLLFVFIYKHMFLAANVIVKHTYNIE